VAPLYNLEHVYAGQHLSDLERRMRWDFGKTERGLILKNQIPRYHYLEFPPDVAVVNSVVDFKHYFAVTVETLKGLRKGNCVCRIDSLFREDLSHRFAAFLSRIGIPEQLGDRGGPSPPYTRSSRQSS
jgi:hypothetical protein